MQGFSRTNTSPFAEWWRTVDKGLIAAALILIGGGLVLSMVASPAAASRIGYSDPYYFFYRHAAFAAVATMVLFAASLLDERWVRRLAVVVFIVGFVLMAVVLLAGHEAKGAQRWIRIGGSTFQPSELVKPALIVAAGWLLSQRRRYPGGPWEVVAFCFYAATMGLLLLQPDVGQAVLLSAAFGAVFFVSGLSWIWGMGMASGGVALAFGLYHLLPHVRRRVDSFFSPSGFDTYQVDKAHEAIERGGAFGVGPGAGQVKFDLPDAHTDFVYSVLGEEFGLVWCVALIIFVAVITVKGIMSAANHPEPFPRAASVGLFTMFGLQAAINIAVNVSLIPPKGMTLPLVSSGGSSLIGSALTLGLAFALLRRPPDVSLKRLLPR
ncbi:cell division protein FtsW [bacterium]|nr:cell division protein FtsW [bacterium]